MDSLARLYPARGEMRRSGKGGRASVRAGGDRRRLGRSLALRGEKLTLTRPIIHPVFVDEPLGGWGRCRRSSASPQECRGGSGGGAGPAGLTPATPSSGAINVMTSPGSISPSQAQLFTAPASPSQNGSIPTTRGITLGLRMCRYEPDAPAVVCNPSGSRADRGVAGVAGPARYKRENRPSQEDSYTHSVFPFRRPESRIGM